MHFIFLPNQSIFMCVKINSNLMYTISKLTFLVQTRLDLTEKNLVVNAVITLTMPGRKIPYIEKSAFRVFRMRRSTPNQLYSNSCPKGPLSNRGSRRSKTIMRFEKVDFFVKKYMKIIIMDCQGSKDGLPNQ